MSNHEHILVANNTRKQEIERLLGQPHTSTRSFVNVDDVEYLISFKRAYTNEEKIGLVFSSVIRFPYASKLVQIVHHNPELFELNGAPRLLSIKDNLSLAERVQDAFNTILVRDINVESLSEIRDYLLRHLDLIDLLPFVARLAAEDFGPDTHLSFELYKDPEVEDTYLAFLARSRKYDQGFFEAIKRIRSGYTDLLAGKSGWILVTTDFDAPQQGE